MVAAPRKILAEEGVRARGQDALAHVGPVVGGVDDDARRLLRPAVADALAYLDTIHFRHHDVQQDYVGYLAGNALQSFASAGHTPH
jgi:hypothetical protein